MARYCGKESLGEALHTALRKGCDSPATSAAHIAINLMPNSLWNEYVKVVGEYLQKAREEKRLTEGNAWEHLLWASTGELSRGFREALDEWMEKLREWKAKGGFYCKGEPSADGKTYDQYKLSVKGRCSVQCKDCRSAKKDTLLKPPRPEEYRAVKGATVYYPMDGVASDRDASRANVTKFLKSIEPTEKGLDDVLYERDRWRWLFYEILKTFSDDDWRGFACFLYV